MVNSKIGKKNLLISIIVLIPILIFSQENIKNSGIKINIQSHGNIQYANVGEFKKGEPCVFFIAGSLPTPSFSTFNNVYYYTGPQSIMKLSNSYNLIILGKPCIPIVVKYKDFPKDFIYKDTSGTIPKCFMLNDNMDYYINNYSEIIKHITKEYSSEENYVLGHSQGARIASKLGYKDSLVDGVVVMSADPLGRIATQIDSNYNRGIKEGKTEYLTHVLKDGSNSLDSSFMKSTYYSWKSFSFPMIVTLFSIKKPVLILYGENDKSCPNCYVYSYINVYKSNIVSHSIPGNHNFINKSGVMHWDTAVKYIINWIKEH